MFFNSKMVKEDLIEFRTYVIFIVGFCLTPNYVIKGIENIESFNTPRTIRISKRFDVDYNMGKKKIDYVEQ